MENLAAVKFLSCSYRILFPDLGLCKAKITEEFRWKKMTKYTAFVIKGITRCTEYVNSVK